MNQPQQFRKVYVEVQLTVSPEGDVRPNTIKFEDGTVYEIDRLRHRCRAHATKVGGTGIRYTVVIRGQETYLFEDDGKWFVEAKDHYERMTGESLRDGTYEAIGLHFNGNPYGMPRDILVPHGCDRILIKRDFDSIKEWLEVSNAEGLVFWLNGEPVCKIKRSDFGFKWPAR